MSVVMAAYNAEVYLREAIDSILRQSLRELELIIIDDGSTDGSREIVDTVRDSRVVRLKNDMNVGPAESANRGLRGARAEYVAVMHADDVSEPERLRKEVEFLDEHPGVTVVATWARFIYADRRSDDMWTASANPNVLAWELTWRSPINHSSVMMRRDHILEIGAYDPRFRSAEDHKLWTEVIRRGKTISVVPEALNCYRRWPDQLSVKDQIGQGRESVEIVHGYVEWLLSRAVAIQQVEGMIGLYRGTKLERGANLAWYTTLASEVEARCAELYGRADTREIKDRVSDVLIFAAANALKQGARLQARRNLLHALRGNPGRAIRPWTLQLLAASFGNHGS